MTWRSEVQNGDLDTIDIGSGLARKIASIAFLFTLINIGLNSPFYFLWALLLVVISTAIFLGYRTTLFLSSSVFLLGFIFFSKNGASPDQKLLLQLIFILPIVSSESSLSIDRAWRGIQNSISYSRALVLLFACTVFIPQAILLSGMNAQLRNGYWFSGFLGSFYGQLVIYIFDRSLQSFEIFCIFISYLPVGICLLSLLPYRKTNYLASLLCAFYAVIILITGKFIGGLEILALSALFMPSYRFSEKNKEFPKIYFDPDCGFCKKLSRLIAVCLGYPLGRVQPASLSPEIRSAMTEKNSWIIETRKGLYGEFAGFLQLLKTSPVWSSSYFLFLIWPLPLIGQKIYRVVANNRSVFGKFTRKIRLTEDIQVSSKSIKSFAIVISILLSLSNTTSLMPIQASSIKWIKINLSIHGLFGFDR